MSTRRHAFVCTLRKDFIQADDSKKNKVVYTIHLDPDDANDTTNMNVRHYSGGRPEEWLQWRREWEEFKEAKELDGTNVAVMYRSL